MSLSTEVFARCNEYLDQRSGTFEFRCIRYEAVTDRLLALGLEDGDLIVDVGAGRCEFDHYLRTRRGLHVRYVPVDGSIDGTDLEKWIPPFASDFFVAIELLEHLNDPIRLMNEMMGTALKGIVATTPNPLTTDVLGMDYTHKTEIFPETFEQFGWDVREVTLFGQEQDSLLAWYEIG
jgi:hypothetical protein